MTNEEIKRILCHQYIPTGEHAEVLAYLWSREQDYALQLVCAFNCGVMVGKQAEW